MAMLELREAQDWVTTRCQPLAPVDIPIGDALGCVLAEDVSSDDPVPPFANTAMDGFAVRAADVATVPRELTVIATLAAGGVPSEHVGAGQAIRIMTGAAMPPGADAIVPVENVDGSVTDPSIVRVLVAAAAGDAVRAAGEDIAAGQSVFAPGTVLGPGHLGVLVSVGRRSVRGHRRVRVGVLSTGDELVEAPLPMRIGQIRDSNRYTLAALVRQAGAEPVDLGLAPDDDAEIERRVRDGLERCDAIVTSGGVSVGDFDFVKSVLDRLSKESADPMRWMQIAIRPAKPLAFGLIGGKPVFGLPGNPVSCMVSFELFARPGLRRMMGHADDRIHRRALSAIAGEDFRRRRDGKTTFVRVQAVFGDDGRLVVRSSGGQGSNLLRAMAIANALAVLPDGDGVTAGESLDVLLLHPPE